MIDLDKSIPGSKLHPDDKRHVLSAFVHRHTKDHIPTWANKPWKDGKPYPVLFDSDQDWLRNTLFQVTDNGRLDMRVHECYSTPTYPDNPELRKG